jgi:hypothetical protein
VDPWGELELDILRHLEHPNVVRGLGYGRWPDPERGSFYIDKLHEHPRSTVALTFYAPAEAKRLETTEEALKAVVEKCDFIVY